MTEFDSIARFYDLDYEDRLEDIDLYEAFAKRCGSPILEIGVGTGRVAVPLAQAGYEVTGVDRSKRMLDLAREKARTAGVADRIQLVQADARHLNLERQFKMAIIAASSLMHFTTPVDQAALLRSIGQHLERNGLLLIDVVNPYQELLTEPDGVLVHEYTRLDPKSGRTITKLRSWRVDQASQTVAVQYFYDEVARDGAVRRTPVKFDLHYFVSAELSLLLIGNGYRIERVYGSYDLTDYSSDSPSMIYVALRTDG